MKYLAHFISILFLPLLMPIYGLLIAFNFESVQQSASYLDNLYINMNKETFLYLFTIFCFVAPGLSLLMLKFNKSISSVQLDNKEERKSPIIITGIYYFIMFFFLIYQDEGSVPRVLLATCLAGGFASFIALAINFRTKISLHMLGVGSLLGFIIAYFQTLEYFNINIIYVIIAVAVLCALARLYLNKHSLLQIGLGYGVGLLTQIITIALYLKFT